MFLTVGSSNRVRVVPPTWTPVIELEILRNAPGVEGWNGADYATAIVDKWSEGMTQEMARWIFGFDDAFLLDIVNKAGLASVSGEILSPDLRLGATAVGSNRKAMVFSNGPFEQVIFASHDGAASLFAHLMGAKVVSVLTTGGEDPRLTPSFLFAIESRAIHKKVTEVVMLDVPMIEALSLKAAWKRASLKSEMSSSHEQIVLKFHDIEEALGHRWKETIFVITTRTLKKLEAYSVERQTAVKHWSDLNESQEFMIGTRMSIATALLQISLVGHLTVFDDSDGSVTLANHLESVIDLSSVRHLVGIRTQESAQFNNALVKAPGSKRSLGHVRPRYRSEGS